MNKQNLINQTVSNLLKSSSVSNKDKRKLKKLIVKNNRKKKRKFSKKKKSTFDWKKPYKDYLKSKKWRELRETILQRDNYTCTRCGSKNNLQVHHLTYKRLKHEKPEDLITLCKQCHYKEHKKHPNKNNRN